MKQKTVLKPTLRRAGRTAITTCAYNAEGSVIAGGLADGSIQLWDVRGASNPIYSCPWFVLHNLLWVISNFFAWELWHSIGWFLLPIFVAATRLFRIALRQDTTLGEGQCTMHCQVTWVLVCTGKVGRSAAIGQVAVPKAQMVPKQDWSYVAGAKTNLQGCHEKDSDISSLCFSSAGTMLLSRAADDTLKVQTCPFYARPRETPAYISMGVLAGAALQLNGIG